MESGPRQPEDRVSVSAVAGSDQPPTVSALLPFGDVRRLGTARQAVTAFADQIYPHRQLVIANSTGTPVLADPTPLVRELMLPVRPTTIGALRNAAVAAATGSWFVHWDDDDYQDPLLLVYHVACRRPGHASLLTHQVRYNGLNRSVYHHVDPDGIAATIFWPRQDAAVGYPDSSRRETEAFWIEHWSWRTHLVRNHTFPANCFSVAVYHALNAAPIAEFMVDHVGYEFADQWALGPREAARFRAVLGALGLIVEDADPAHPSLR